MLSIQHELKVHWLPLLGMSTKPLALWETFYAAQKCQSEISGFQVQGRPRVSKKKKYRFMVHLQRFEPYVT